MTWQQEIQANQHQQLQKQSEMLAPPPQPYRTAQFAAPAPQARAPLSDMSLASSVDTHFRGRQQQQQQQQEPQSNGIETAPPISNGTGEAFGGAKRKIPSDSKRVAKVTKFKLPDKQNQHTWRPAEK